MNIARTNQKRTGHPQWVEEAHAALRAAVSAAAAEYRSQGVKLAVWKNGRVVELQLPRRKAL